MEDVLILHGEILLAMIAAKIFNCFFHPACIIKSISVCLELLDLFGDIDALLAYFWSTGALVLRHECFELIIELVNFVSNLGLDLGQGRGWGFFGSG